MSGTPEPVHASGQYVIGGDLPVYRLGYGTMQLTGPGHWYHPDDPDAAKRLLRRVVELGHQRQDVRPAPRRRRAPPRVHRDLASGH